MPIDISLSDMAVVMSNIPSLLMAVGLYTYKAKKTPLLVKQLRERKKASGIARPKINHFKYLKKSVIAKLPDGTYAFHIGLWPRMQQALADSNTLYVLHDNRDMTLRPLPDITAFLGFQFRHGQDLAIAHIATADSGIILCPTGWGKCHDPLTEILMSDGSFRRVAEIHVGDTVMGIDGTPRKVTDTTEGQSPMYRFCTLNVGAHRALTPLHILIVCTINPYGISLELGLRPYKQYLAFSLSVKLLLQLDPRLQKELRFLRAEYSVAGGMTPLLAYAFGFLMVGATDVNELGTVIALTSMACSRLQLYDDLRQRLFKVGLAYNKKDKTLRYVRDFSVSDLCIVINRIMALVIKSTSCVHCDTGLILVLRRSGTEAYDAFTSGIVDVSGTSLQYLGDVSQVLDIFASIGIKYTAYAARQRVSLHPKTIMLRNVCTRDAYKVIDTTRRRMVKFRIYDEPILGPYKGILVLGDHLYILKLHIVTHNSTVIGKICKMYPYLNIVVATSSTQVMKTLYNNIIKLCPGLVGSLSGLKDTSNGKRIVVSTLRSLSKLDPLKVHLLMIDEAHGIGDNLAGSVVAQFVFGRRFGFTATPTRNDGSGRVLLALLGPVLMTVSYLDAVLHDMVVPLKYVMLPCTQGPNFLKDLLTALGKLIRKDLPQDVRKRFSYWRNTYRNRAIANAVKAILRLLPLMQILIMVLTLQHAIALHSMLPNFLVAYYGASSKLQIALAIAKAGLLGKKLPKDYLMSSKDLDRVRGAFLKGTLKRVISTTTFRQGVDFRQLAIIVRADGRTSFVDCIQIPGRAARTALGKLVGYVVDVLDRHDGWAHLRAQTRELHYKNQKWLRLTLLEMIDELKNIYQTGSELSVGGLPTLSVGVESR